ncbi:hypothetical protein PTSG_01203 [Salpingoeca rosetta]|uniref:Protein MCM10 homolog n=1 Tax=Salpingoeca rosetta (strain ATCC 50818 / BSB-021) TaxID=946362 RepID=F2U140_SALR5|nr:uncharacterized protein PTSG_01203 [Salpingoeca rosetta]EGD80614.1 hypothetical protein PTSG_01203 [Salpingoeca rosetta]|eukprot:XP_004997175.1 hypothetical protein PTSG_01203 [Salpingoeca rosetta]
MEGDSGFWATDDLSDIFGDVDEGETTKEDKKDAAEAEKEQDSAQDSAALQAQLAALEQQLAKVRGQLNKANSTKTTNNSATATINDNTTTNDNNTNNNTNSNSAANKPTPSTNATTAAAATTAARKPSTPRAAAAPTRSVRPQSTSGSQKQATPGMTTHPSSASLTAKQTAPPQRAVVPRNAPRRPGTSGSASTSGASPSAGTGAKVTTSGASNWTQSDKDEYTGLRLKNRTIGSLQLKSMMSGRKFVPIRDIVSVLRHRAKSPESATETIVTFGVVAKKSPTKQTSKGANYAIWTMSDLNHDGVGLFVSGAVHAKHWRENAGVFVGISDPVLMEERAGSRPMLTVRDESQLLMVGTCSDFAMCKAFTKDGKPCSWPVNLQLGEYCQAHVGSAYRKKKRQSRQVLNLGMGPNPNARTVLAARQRSGGRPSPSPSSSTGLARGASVVGKSASSSSSSKKAKTPMEKMKSQLRLEAVTSLSANNTFRKAMRTMTSSNPLAKKMVEHEFREAAKKRDGSFLNRPRSGVRPDTQASTSVLTATCDKLLALNGQSRPMLARGAQAGSQIQLSKARDPYARAAALARSKGGFAKVDPNAPVSPSSQDVDVDKLRKRVARREVTAAEDREARTSKRPKSSVLTAIVGDIDSEETKAMLERKSKHLDEFHEAEEKELMRMLARGEELEKMEEKMKTIKETTVVCHKCSTCKRLTMRAPKLCIDNGHAVNKVKTKKRFFQCGNCNKHTFTLGARLPGGPCPDCGKVAWNIASMFKGRRSKRPEFGVKTHFGDQPR